MRELSIAEMTIPAGGESEGDYGAAQQVAAYGANNQFEAWVTETLLDKVDPWGIVERPSYVDTGLQCQPISSPFDGFLGGNGNDSGGSMNSAGEGFGGSTSGESGFC